jgi:hypothetical protein
LDIRCRGQRRTLADAAAGAKRAAPNRQPARTRSRPSRRRTDLHATVRPRSMPALCLSDPGCRACTGLLWRSGVPFRAVGVPSSGPMASLAAMSRTVSTASPTRSRAAWRPGEEGDRRPGRRGTIACRAMRSRARPALRDWVPSNAIVRRRLLGRLLLGGSISGTSAPLTVALMTCYAACALARGRPLRAPASRSHTGAAAGSSRRAAARRRRARHELRRLAELHVDAAVRPQR